MTESNCNAAARAVREWLTSGFPFVVSGRLVESILCDAPPLSSNELTRARVKAAFATDAKTKEEALLEAAVLADSVRFDGWRDALRSHMDLAEFFYASGKSAECAREIQLSLDLLEKYFSPGNKGMAELHFLRGVCLSATGCNLGADLEIQKSQRMMTGNR